MSCCWCKVVMSRRLRATILQNKKLAQFTYSAKPLSSPPIFFLSVFSCSVGVNIVFSVEPFDFWKSFYFVNAELFTFTDILTRNFSNLLIRMYSKNIETWLWSWVPVCCMSSIPERTHRWNWT